jgi:hypothetical protein
MIQLNNIIYTNGIYSWHELAYTFANKTQTNHMQKPACFSFDFWLVITFSTVA